MIRRIILAAALLAAPAMLVAGQPAHKPGSLTQAADTSKGKTTKKHAMHKKGGKTATPKAGAQDSSKAK